MGGLILNSILALVSGEEPIFVNGGKCEKPVQPIKKLPVGTPAQYSQSGSLQPQATHPESLCLISVTTEDVI